MPNDPQPALGDLIGKRLAELVHAGWLTPTAWQATVRHGPVSLTVIADYLERCWQAPPHAAPDA